MEFKLRLRVLVRKNEMRRGSGTNLGVTRNDRLADQVITVSAVLQGLRTVLSAVQYPEEQMERPNHPGTLVLACRIALPAVQNRRALRPSPRSRDFRLQHFSCGYGRRKAFRRSVDDVDVMDALGEEKLGWLSVS